LNAGYPALVDPDSYTFSNALGAYMKSQNQNGVLVRSSRCEEVNAAIFTPLVLSDVRDLCFLTYTFYDGYNVVVDAYTVVGGNWGRGKKTNIEDVPFGR
jgi:hypothetical protein